MRYKVILGKSEGGFSVSVPGLPGVNHLDAVRALEKAGFWIARQGKHVVMTDGTRIVGSTATGHGDDAVLIHDRFWATELAARRSGVEPASPLVQGIPPVRVFALDTQQEA